MQLICDIIGLRGVTMSNYNEKKEKIILEMVKQKEESDKRMLSLEIVIGFLSMAFLLTLTFIASFLQMEEWLRIILIISGLLVGIIGCMFGIKIEQTAGYYECEHCHHKYVPTYNSVLWAMHINRTRYMKCPECHKWSWQKKVISKE